MAAFGNGLDNTNPLGNNNGSDIELNQHGSEVAKNGVISR